MSSSKKSQDSGGGASHEDETRHLREENKKLTKEVDKLSRQLNEAMQLLQIARLQISANNNKASTSVSTSTSKKKDKGKRKKEDKPEEESSGAENCPTKVARKEDPAANTARSNPRDNRETQKSPTFELDADELEEIYNMDDEDISEDELPIPEKPKSKTRGEIPPIIVRHRDKWTEVSKLLTANKAKLIKDGIAVTPATAEDHRKTTRTLLEKKVEYHTYTLQENRQVRVVVRGIPSGVPVKDVEEDLKRQGYKPTQVHRMVSRRTKQEMPLILVQVPPDEEDILEVTRCCSLVVKVEHQKLSTVQGQCHRCQQFGHAQSRCTAQVRCVKCGDKHHSGDCDKPRDMPAKCVNCGGPHPASYRGCPSAPKPATRKTTRDPQTNQAQYTAPPRTAPTMSFAEAARQKRAPVAAPRGVRLTQQQGTTPAEFASALAKMQFPTNSYPNMTAPGG